MAYKLFYITHSVIFRNKIEEFIMNYRTMLLATAAALFSTQAMAADLTNPFFTPGQGQITSDTNVGYYRVKAKHDGGVAEGYYAAETLEYGITDKFSINGTIANMFDTQGAYNNDHNFAYQIGAKYNTNCDKVLFQVAANYMTFEPQSFYGNEASNKWYKRLDGEVKLGYDLGNGLTPYASYNISGNIDDSNRDLDQSVKAGIHKYAGKYALDLGLRYNFSTDGGHSLYNGSYNDLWAEAAADYYVKENIAVGIYGSYRIDGSYDKDLDYAYTAGAHVKVLF